MAAALIWLDRLARHTDSPRPEARTLQNVNPSTLTAVGIALAGGLMVFDVDWGGFRAGTCHLRRDGRRAGQCMAAVDQVDRLIRQRENRSVAPVTRPNVTRFARLAASVSTFLPALAGRSETSSPTRTVPPASTPQ